jgi:soluble lytic murein transglycosylase-like protein
MKAKLNAAFILLTTMGFFCIPAHAQLASYLDEQGNLVYTNSTAPAPRITPAKSSSAPISSQGSPSPQPASAPAPAPTQAPAAAPPSAPAALAPAQPLVPVIQAPAALDQMVQQTAEKHNVDPALVRAVISTESNWNASALSSKGAQGLMQLVPGTARQLGVGNAFDPAQNVDGGVRYLGMLLQRYNGDLKLALAAYNAGPSIVDRFGGVPNYRETRNYVEKVTSTYFRPGSDRHAYGYSAPKPIYRTTDADGRVVFTNE